MTINKSNANDVLLEVKNVSKTFFGVRALDNVNLRINKGEVLALMGENGAGKTTLMKILAGVFQADIGNDEIIFENKKVRYINPLEAKKDGIVMIFQELSLVLDLTVAENIYLGSLPRKNKFSVDWKKTFSDAKKVLESIECNIDPSAIVRSLPIAQQQLVEIGRALALGARAVIFDEPTSSLTDKEKNSLFFIIKKLKAQGVGIIYISHKMDEVFEISDRIVVLRDGKNSGEFKTKSTNLTLVVECMIGRSINEYFHKSNLMPGEEILRIENLALHHVFKDINFNIRKGEVVGLYGLVGAGRTEIVETIFGIREKTSGTVYFEGKPINIKDSEDAVKTGIGLVPEDRRVQGLVLGMNCKENISLANLPSITNWLGIVERRTPDAIYEEYKKKLGIVSPSPLQKVVNLSGGNQQKVVIAKWLCTNPKLLILDEPTRGIDVGSKAEIHKLIASLAEAGIGVLVISSEMLEIIGICNRIIAISQGQITAELKGDEITEKNLIKAITVSKQKSQNEDVKNA